MMRRYWSLGLFWGVVTLVRAADAPPLAVHFFTEDDEPPVALAQQVTAEGNDLQMVIFADEADVPLADRVGIVTDDAGFNVSYRVDSTYRHERLGWQVAGPGGSPETLTEMQWDDVSLVGGAFGLEMALPSGLVFNAEGGYARVVAGEGRQLYYAGEQRSGLFSDRAGDTDAGYAWDATLGMGYRFRLGQGAWRWALTPMAGYAWRKQQWETQSSRERLAAAPLNEEDNRYAMQWWGPWLGIGLTLDAFERHQLFSRFEQHWVDYEGRGAWGQSPLLQQPESFRHDSEATGLLARGGYRYFVDETWALNVAFQYEDWVGDAGDEQLYSATGESIRSAFHGLRRESMGVNLGLNMRF